MTDEPMHEQAAGPDTGTRLAFDRTYLAHERTQMAWLRTVLALIGFGFTISKVFEYLHQQQGDKGPLLSPRGVGILMISIGLVALTLSTIQHRRAMKMLREQCPGLPVSLAAVTAGLLAILGILAMVSAVLRQ